MTVERDTALLEPVMQAAAIKRDQVRSPGVGDPRHPEASMSRRNWYSGRHIPRRSGRRSRSVSCSMVGGIASAGPDRRTRQEIDAQAQATTRLLSDLGRTQRAMMATPIARNPDPCGARLLCRVSRPRPRRKLTVVAAYAVGRIVASGMADFGEAFCCGTKSVMFRIHRPRPQTVAPANAGGGHCDGGGGGAGDEVPEQQGLRRDIGSYSRHSSRRSPSSCDNFVIF